VRKLGVIVVCVVSLALAACDDSSNDSSASGDGGGAAADGLQVDVVSTRADMVTGGDVLLSLGDATGTPRASVDDRDLTVTALGDDWLVGGLPDGESTLDVEIGDESGSVDVTNYPPEGPVFSGPHMPLLACSTEGFDLGPSTPDDNCFAATKVDYLSGSTTGGALQPLAGPPPAAGASETGTYVVRRERGVINRAVYEIAVPEENWNGRLIYRFGGGCGTSFGQGGFLGSAEAPEYLSQGYAVATSTFNTFQTQCNDVLSAETLMMVKEHFIETFGPVVHTIGEGGSGGAIQQHLIIQNYPGLLDAGVAALPFPDAISIAAGVTDCGLLNKYYKSAAGSALTTEQQTAINGHAVPATCELWQDLFLEGITPQDGCAPAIPKSEIYDPETNPDGLRCTLADANINQLGTDAETGFANRPVDNIGVQYGLNALNDGAITADQFLALNEAIGGYDVDGNMVAEREEASKEVIANAYATGRVSQGGGDQKKVPIIDFNVYTDFAGDIHDRFRAFSLRDRLESPNFLIWTVNGAGVDDAGDVIGNLATVGGGVAATAISTLDEWLETGEPPATAVDTCVVGEQKLTGDGIYESGPCFDAYPIHGDPRTAAGAPRRNDILKCALKAVDAADYEVEFTAAQEQRLEQVFPDGVCDWTRKGVGQVPLRGTWLKY
jgi:hypothetical protein